MGERSVFIRTEVMSRNKADAEVYECRSCGREFRVIPARMDWQSGCTAPDCSSYRVEQDVDLMIDAAWGDLL